MSSANPKSQEPSMEEILASIRRIIADDQEVGKSPEPQEPSPSAPSPPEEDVLDLADIAPAFRKPARPPLDLDEADVSFREIESSRAVFDAVEPRDEPPPMLRAPEAAPASRGPSLEDRLLSSAADASVGQAFNLLAHTVLSSNARTLEDLVREMLRPMLKNWLDDNLPSIVERLVRAEIERVARGR